MYSFMSPAPLVTCCSVWGKQSNISLYFIHLKGKNGASGQACNEFEVTTPFQQVKSWTHSKPNSDPAEKQGHKANHCPPTPDVEPQAGGCRDPQLVRAETRRGRTTCPGRETWNSDWWVLLHVTETSCFQLGQRKRNYFEMHQSILFLTILPKHKLQFIYLFY